MGRARQPRRRDMLREFRRRNRRRDDRLAGRLTGKLHRRLAAAGSRPRERASESERKQSGARTAPAPLNYSISRHAGPGTCFCSRREGSWQVLCAAACAGRRFALHRPPHPACVRPLASAACPHAGVALRDRGGQYQPALLQLPALVDSCSPPVNECDTGTLRRRIALAAHHYADAVPQPPAWRGRGTTSQAFSLEAGRPLCSAHRRSQSTRPIPSYLSPVGAPRSSQGPAARPAPWYVDFCLCAVVRVYSHSPIRRWTSSFLFLAAAIPALLAPDSSATFRGNCCRRVTRTCTRAAHRYARLVRSTRRSEHAHKSADAGRGGWLFSPPRPTRVYSAG